MKNIYLVGFMGTGKSAVGRALAENKKWKFIDLDEFIELREKKAIPDIFAQKGEAYFRRLEKKALKEVAKEEKFVVACGGGIVVDADNIKAMKETGKIICLKASPKKILERVSGTLHRPLLNVQNPQERIELLLKLRSSYYAKAHKCVDTSRLSIKEVTARILKILSK
jgi:shikimate kinase